MKPQGYRYSLSWKFSLCCTTVTEFNQSGTLYRDILSGSIIDWDILSDVASKFSQTVFEQEYPIRNKLDEKKKSQPRPQGTFPWLWRWPKPGKSALGMGLEIFVESSRNKLFYDSAILGGRDNHYTMKTKNGGKLNYLNKVNAYGKNRQSD